MIARIQEAEDPAPSPALRRARRKVASSFLERQSYPADDGPPVPIWQAWLFAAWVVVVTVAYAAAMAGLF